MDWPAAGTAAALKLRDYGTSRWQLMIERYTNYPCIGKGCVMATPGPAAEDAAVPRNHRTWRGSGRGRRRYRDVEAARVEEADGEEAGATVR